MSLFTVPDSLPLGKQQTSNDINHPFDVVACDLKICKSGQNLERFSQR